MDMGKQRGGRNCVVMTPAPKELAVYFSGTKIIQQALGNSISHKLKEQKIDFTRVLNTE